MTQNNLQLPTLDLSQPLLPSTLTSLSKACKELGCFHVSNHGVSVNLYRRLRALSFDVFNLPLETKLKAGPLSSIKTYTPPFIASPFFETLRVSGPDYFSSAKHSFDALFDHPSNELCEILEDYGSKMIDLCTKIVRILLKCFGDGIETKYYESEFGRCHGYLRINHYTPPNGINELEQEQDVEGLGMHTDMSCITLLYQDEIGGLQAEAKGGEWVEITPGGDGALVVIVGDLMQAWTNGRMRSLEHRVVLRKPVTRLSLAYLWCFEDEKTVSAPDEVVGEEGGRRIYRPFLCRDYNNFREYSEEGAYEKVQRNVDGFAQIDYALDSDEK